MGNYFFPLLLIITNIKSVFSFNKTCNHRSEKKCLVFCPWSNVGTEKEWNFAKYDKKPTVSSVIAISCYHHCLTENTRRIVCYSLLLFVADRPRYIIILLLNKRATRIVSLYKFKSYDGCVFFLDEKAP